jgi:hypothetical protein
MKLRQAIKESELRAAFIMIPGHHYRYVVSQIGPFTFPDNFMDIHYGTEIHHYDSSGNLTFGIVNFMPINWAKLRIQLGEYIDSNRWCPYTEPITPKRIEKFDRKVEPIQLEPLEKMKRLFPYLFGD